MSKIYQIVKTLRPVAFALLLAGTFIPVQAQVRGIVNEAETYFIALQSDKSATFDRSLLENSRAHQDLLDLSLRFYADSSEWIRYKACSFAADVARYSSEEQIRSRATELLVDACADRAHAVRNYCAGQLTAFLREDFSMQSREKLNTQLSTSAMPDKNLIKLAGYLGNDFYIATLERIALEQSDMLIKWNVYLALARMNEAEYAGKIVRMTQKAPLNDDFVYEAVPDMLYTRNKLVVDHVVEILYSNAKNCMSSNPDSDRKILCGYRVMEYLAPMVEGFPLEVSAGGDIVTDNYTEALDITRKWFQDNEAYVLLDETF